MRVVVVPLDRWKVHVENQFPAAPEKDRRAVMNNYFSFGKIQQNTP